MGNELVSGKFVAVLSRHNSDKDIRHDALWQDFITKIKQIANNPKYIEIHLDVRAYTGEEEE
jgi:hypothetical protein